jgi:hypothetical protein
VAEDKRCTGERIDWDGASMRPMAAGGFVLTVKGEAPVPTAVCLNPRPIGIVPEDYNGIEVLGTPKDPASDVLTPWEVDLPNAERQNGRVGIVLIGATKREYFPPQDA